MDFSPVAAEFQTLKARYEAGAYQPTSGRLQR